RALRDLDLPSRRSLGADVGEGGGRSAQHLPPARRGDLAAGPGAPRGLAPSRGFGLSRRPRPPPRVGVPDSREQECSASSAGFAGATGSGGGFERGWSPPPSYLAASEEGGRTYGNHAEPHDPRPARRGRAGG